MDHGQSIERFSLAPRTTPYEEWNGKTQLLRDGRPTEFFIQGCDLKAQYQCGDYYLLATEYDCPFEESVTVTLLNKASKPIACSTVPRTFYPTLGAARYFFDKIIWQDAHRFELHIQDLPYHFQYTIRESSIPFLNARLRKRMIRNA